MTVVNIWKRNAASIFSKSQQTILSAATIIMVSVAASRLLGLVRLRLLAYYFGSQIQTLDAFIAANVLPEAIFEVLIFGAVSVAFIPVFTSYLAKNEKKAAWDLAGSVLNLGVLGFTVVATILIIFAPFLPQFLSPGLVRNYPELNGVIANLMRVMIFAQIFFVGSAFLTGILQSFKFFLLPAMAAVLYNLGIIFGIVVLSPFLGIYGPAWGMVIGAILHLLIQIPVAKKLGASFELKINFHHPGLARIIILMVPRSFGLAILRTNDVVNVALASLLISGSIVAFSFAETLYLVPLGLFAASIAQAALPTLSLTFAQSRMREFKDTFLNSFHQILFLVLPSAAILAILRIPVVRLVFGAKQFPWDSTVLTGRTLIIFSAGLAAAAVNLILVRGFYALHDTKTPVAINVFTVFINMVLSVVFILVLGKNVLWLAGSYSAVNILNALALLFFLDRKVEKFSRKHLILPALKMGTAALLMAISLYVPMKFLDQLVFDTTHTLGLIALTGVASFFGIFVYISLTLVFRVKEAIYCLRFLRKITNIKNLPFISEIVEPAPQNPQNL